MTALRQTMHRYAALWLALAALALALRALIPAGMMVRSDSLTLTVSICSDASGGMRLAQLTIPREHIPAPQESAATGHCAFAGLGSPALAPPPPLAPLLPAPAPLVLAPAALLASQAPGAPAHAWPPPTAPPLADR